jgi:hypothetical protein
MPDELQLPTEIVVDHIAEKPVELAPSRFSCKLKCDNYAFYGTTHGAEVYHKSPLPKLSMFFPDADLGRQDRFDIFSCICAQRKQALRCIPQSNKKQKKQQKETLA